jgi:hypothetical protein
VIVRPDSVPAFSIVEVATRHHRQGREKQERFFRSRQDGFTATRPVMARATFYSGKFIFFKNAL